jgi:hypothetical protein
LEDKTMKYAGMVVALVLLAFLIMEFNRRTEELNRLQKEQEMVTERLNSRRQTYSALEAQMAYATSDSAAMEWGYENHMALPGDLVLAPREGAQVTPTPTPRPQITPTQQDNFSEWLRLFFNEETP